MEVFPTAAHCASWAGLCPGQNESAGVSRSVRTKKGNRFIRRYLSQSAWAVSHCKDGYLRALFHRIKASRGWGKAVVAVAHKILVIVYQLLKTDQLYRDLGGDYFDRLNPTRTIRRLMARFERIGFRVTLTPLPAAATGASVTPATEATEAPPKRKRGRPRKSPAVELISTVVPTA